MSSSHLSEPSAVAITTDGLVYVADTGHRRVKTFHSSTGLLLHEIYVDDSPSGLALCESQGMVYVSLMTKCHILVFPLWRSDTR